MTERRYHAAFKLQVVLAVIAALYFIAYFAHSATPGNSPNAHPMGWWGWFDQGQYLQSANALKHWDLTPGKHFYPPLYPGLGALLLSWSSGHPFILLNLLALLWFCYVFIRFSDLYFARWISVALLLASTVLNPRIFENYVIPWTSTLGVGLLATGMLALVWLREVEQGTRQRLTSPRFFLVALCLGLLLPTRPADAVVGAVIGLGLLLGYVRLRLRFSEAVPGPARVLVASGAGLAVGPLIYFGFNLATYGSVFGGYLQATGSSGFPVADLAEKFVSLWLDSATLYGESGAGLAQRQPWLLIGLAGLAFVMARGDLRTRTVGAAIVVLFLIYMPFGDLLPNGLWRFLNVHYFKWTFPFFALMALLLLREAAIALKSRNWLAMPVILLVGIPAVLLTLGLKLEASPAAVRVAAQGGALSVDLPRQEVDFVDFAGLTGTFTEVYFGEHRLSLDGRELQRVKEYRVLPMARGVRLLFIRPVHAQTLILFPDARLLRHTSQLQAQAGNYRVALGAPRPFRETTVFEPAMLYRLGDPIDFSQAGNGFLYAGQGWSDPEAWGRWSTGKEAGIRLRLAEPGHRPLELELVLAPLVNGRHPCQQLRLSLNQRELATRKLCEQADVPASLLKFRIDPGQFGAGEVIEIRLETPDAVSPKSLGIGRDRRVLGMGLRSLRLSALPLETAQE